MATRPKATHRRTLDLAELLRQTAPMIHTAKEHIARELQISDGYASGTLGDGGSRATGSRSIVERTTLDRRQTLTEQNTQLDDDLTAIQNIIWSARRTCGDIGTTHVPEESLGAEYQRCNQGRGQHLEGYIAWTNPLCQDLVPEEPIVPGMCDTCVRSAMNPWRIEHGLEPMTRESDSRRYHDARSPRGRFASFA